MVLLQSCMRRNFGDVYCMSVYIIIIRQLLKRIHTLRYFLGQMYHKSTRSFKGISNDIAGTFLLIEMFFLHICAICY